MASKRNCGVKLGRLCPKITRGIQLSKTQIKQCVTSVPTEYRYLTLADLDKTLNVGLDIENLPYFDPTPLGKNVDRFCIKQGMILLSKNDTPYKVDFVDDIGDEKIIINGNIYMMTVDTEMVNPACLCLWFKSDEGIRELKNASSDTNGGKMKWISIKQLNEMLVPEFTAEKQSELINAKIEELEKSIKYMAAQLVKSTNIATMLLSMTPGNGDN